MNNLVICPTGNPISFDDRFNKEEHWRHTLNKRTYETLVIQYGNYEPPENTYDMLIKEKGQKWALIKDLLNVYDYSKYEYIAFFDDDLITDICNLNKAFELAKEKDLKLFQLSVTNDSDVFYPILRNKPDIKYSKTNFIEVMGPVIHTSLIPICLELWNRYNIESGWGFDKILCDLTKTDAAVIHCCQMVHPVKENSSYNKNSAFMEMNELIGVIFPKFMKDKYNEEWSFRESQIEKEIIMENNNE